MNNPKNKTSIHKQQGFTLIELMIVVALIGLLVAVAQPAYQSHINRVKFTEIIAATTAAKTAAEVCAQVKQTFEQQQCPSLSPEKFKVPTAITLNFLDQNSTGMVITATRGKDSYSLKASFSDGMVVWTKSCTPVENCI